MLESVQKFGLKVCLKQWHSTYENLIDQAGMPRLLVIEYRPLLPAIAGGFGGDGWYWPLMQMGVGGHWCWLVLSGLCYGTRVSDQLRAPMKYARNFLHYFQRFFIELVQ